MHIPVLTILCLFHIIHSLVLILNLKLKESELLRNLFKFSARISMSYLKYQIKEDLSFSFWKLYKNHTLGNPNCHYGSLPPPDVLTLIIMCPLLCPTYFILIRILLMKKHHQAYTLRVYVCI